MSQKKVCLPPASRRVSVAVPGRKRKVVALKGADGKVRRWNARARVMNGECLKTSGGLGKDDLMKNNGRIVSKAKVDSAKNGKGAAERTCALRAWRKACKDLGYMTKAKPGYPKKGTADHAKAKAAMKKGCEKRAAVAPRRSKRLAAKASK